jgi:hypothetical protein
MPNVVRNGREKIITQDQRSANKRVDLHVDLRMTPDP